MAIIVEAQQSLEDYPAFGISGENIKSVKIKCKTGNFLIHNMFDKDYREYTFENVFNKTENIIGDDFFLWNLMLQNSWIILLYLLLNYTTQ